jgi:hypothetical protein
MAAGLRKRHSRPCRSNKGGGCNCQPSWEAWVYSKRDGKKIRKTFHSAEQAKAWRTDADRAVRRKKLRASQPITLEQAADQLLEGAKNGSIPKKGGTKKGGSRYKPATLRGYERSLRERILPVLGRMRLTDLERADVQDLADALTAEGLAASTVQNVLDPLRVIYRRAVQRDLVSVDPTEGLELRLRMVSGTGPRSPRRPGGCSPLCRASSARCGRLRCTPGCAAASCARCAGATSTSKRRSSTCAAAGMTRRASRTARATPRSATCRSSTCSRRS